jgi:hypothetical protein
MLGRQTLACGSRITSLPAEPVGRIVTTSSSATCHCSWPNAPETHGTSRTAGKIQERLSASTSGASLGSATHCLTSPTLMLSGHFYLGPPASPWSISWDVKSPRITKELLDIATNHASGEEAVGGSSTVPRARRSAARAPTRAPRTARGRRRTRGTTGGSFAAAADYKGGKAAAGKPPIIFISRRCWRSHARTTPSTSSTCTRTVPY